MFKRISHPEVLCNVYYSIPVHVQLKDGLTCICLFKSAMVYHHLSCSVFQQ